MGARRSVALLVLAALLLCGCERSKPSRVVSRPGPMATETTSTVAALGQEPLSASATVAPTESQPSLPTETPAPLSASATPMPEATATESPLAPTATVAPTVAASPTPAVIRHTVRPGENLFRIALRYRTTVAAIMQENPQLKSPSQLAAGTVLTITLGSGPALRTHVVQRGDTIYSIARRYGVSPQSLLEANGLPNPNRIVAGETLYIP